jgi:apolipoprotein D and lipocalin family protein
MKNFAIKSTILAVISLIVSCQTIPDDVKAVKPFDADRYLGKWYEIARFDFRFERNLNNTTANYSLRDDGTIEVLNRGFNYKENKWEEATGKAKFVDSKNEARLKVSFFGPFYSGYNVIAIDDQYQHALVAGKNHDYLWILSRKPTMPENIKEDFIKKAEAAGFDTSALIWVKHDKP